MAASTIAAIASPPGPGLRGVIRVSGPRAADLVRASFVDARGTPAPLAGRAARAGRFRDGRGEQPCLLLWMPGPGSYTREDVAELHLPGSPPLLAAALERLLALGALPAAPGEFTRRAFLSGRLDLTRAEGVLSLVEAGTRAEARSAAALVAGGLAERVDALRAGLVEARALCEASLDFDEADTADVAAAEIERRAEAVRAGLGAALAWEERRLPAAGEPRLVLAGAPNAGKSTLFNALVGDAPGGGGWRALTSELAGTTRDLLAGAWTVAGTRCRLVDTAGLDPGARGPDADAQALGATERETADLVLWVLDGARRGSDPPPAPPPGPGPPCVRVWSKADRWPAPAPGPDGEPVAVSAVSGAGLAALERRVAARLGLSRADAGAPGAADEGAPGGLARELSARHRRALAAARAEVDEGLAARRAGEPLELFAERLRAATDELDGVTGRTTAEDVLDEVFGRFCIGK